MSIVKMLRAGILRGDWNLVCRVYTKLSGDEIEPSQAAANPIDTLKAMLDKLSPGTATAKVPQVKKRQIPEVEDKPEPQAARAGKKPGRAAPAPAPKPTKPKKQFKGICRQEAWRPVPNEFVDNASDHADLGKESKKLSKKLKNKSKSYRPDAGVITLLCTRCEQEIEVPPSLVPPTLTDLSYVCSECTASGGKRKSTNE